jgi:hypothetical protein
MLSPRDECSPCFVRRLLRIQNSVNILRESGGAAGQEYEDMISLKLTRLIEQHSSGLTDELVKKLHSSPRTRGLQRVAAPELRNRIEEMLSQFHGWLVTKEDRNNVQERYRTLGRQHASQCVSLPDLCWAVVVIKEHLWDFVGQYAFHAAPMDLHAELELTRFVNVFFDGMICYFAEGYEQYRSEMVEPQLHGGETTNRMVAMPRTQIP